MKKQKIFSIILMTLFLFIATGHSFSQVLNDFQVNENLGDCDQENPAIAVDRDGNFVVVWEDKRNGNYDIYCQRYNSSGSPQGANFKVNDDTTSHAQDDPEIAMDEAGNFVVVWADERNGAWDPDIYCQRYTNNGSPQGPNFKVNDVPGNGNHDDPAIAMDRTGNFVVVWEDDRNGWGNENIYCQRYSSNGSPQDANFKVNNDTTSSDQSEPGIAMDGAGNFVVTWEDGRNGGNPDIYCQRYSNSGSPQDTNFKVNDDVGSSWQGISAISVDGAGNFVIVWEDMRNGSGEDIYCQRYSSGGSPQGSNFKVNDDAGNSYQWYPAITIDEDGNFIVVWVDGRNGFSNPDIYAQVFNSTGQLLGTNYRVNNDVGGNNQHYPDVKIVNRHVYFTWQDNRIPGQGLDIFARIDMFNPVSVEERQSQQPGEYILYQNYPNPFNSSTTIQFSLPYTSFVTLKVYNMLGEEVSTLVTEKLASGKYDVEWSASGLPGGVYYYRLQVGQFAETRKLILLK